MELLLILNPTGVLMLFFWSLIPWKRSSRNPQNFPILYPKLILGMVLLVVIPYCPVSQLTHAFYILICMNLTFDGYVSCAFLLIYCVFLILGAEKLQP